MTKLIFSQTKELISKKKISPSSRARETSWVVSSGSLNCKLCDFKNSLTDSVAISNKRDERSSFSVGREVTISFSESAFPLRAYVGSLDCVELILWK